MASDSDILLNDRRPAISNAALMVAYVEQIPKSCPLYVFNLAPNSLPKALVQVEFGGDAYRVTRKFPYPTSIPLSWIWVF